VPSKSNQQEPPANSQHHRRHKRETHIEAMKRLKGPNSGVKANKKTIALSGHWNLDFT
jgi:hypothetical protein